MANELAVRSQALTKEFRNGGGTPTPVLRGVDLQVRYGQITLLVGPSGCGKTTLLSVISGLLDRSGGDLSVLGVDADSLRGSGRVRFRRDNIGFVFQEYNLLPALTAAENAAVPLLAKGVRRSAALRRANELLDRLGMSPRARALPKQLSGGEKQRVALARALVHEPRLVVCDEPTAALDYKSGRSVMELLSAVAVRPDRAVVVVTHDNRVFDFADAMAFMDDGRIVRTEARDRAASPSGAHQ